MKLSCGYQKLADELEKLAENARILRVIDRAELIEDLEQRLRQVIATESERLVSEAEAEYRSGYTWEGLRKSTPYTLVDGERWYRIGDLPKKAGYRPGEPAKPELQVVGGGPVEPTLRPGPAKTRPKFAAEADSLQQAVLETAALLA